MSEIIQFVPKVECEAVENLQGFINLCRNRLTIFGPDLDWDNTWDVTQWVHRHGRKGRIALVWSNHDTSKHKPGEMMAQPFLDFAKSYMRYQHGMRPTKVVGFRLSALRALERALIEHYGTAQVEKADPAVFNQAAQLIREKFEKTTSYRIGAQLEMIADFLVENHLTATAFLWKNPLKRPNDRNRIGKKADKRRAELLPSQAALDALARVFHIAAEPADVVISSTVALLCSAPDRINEVLRLPVDCEVHQKRKNGEEAYGLRWWPSKGADPMVKWVVGTMVDVVKEAIAKLREQTQEARSMAEWYEKNPAKIYLSEGLEHLRQHEFLTTKEIADIIGLAHSSCGRVWADGKGLEKIRGKGRVFYRFKDVESAIIKMLPAKFPILDPETGLSYSNALFVIPHNLFHPKRASYRCMFEAVNIDTINDGLGARQIHGVSSIFIRLGFTEPDGSPIKITTHQFRHWLNTLAQKGGLSQLDIAKWSGRKDIQQNKDYDHVTADELLDKVHNIDDGSMFGPLAEFVAQAPISREEFLELKFSTVHTTELGFCIHDWTMIPCQRHRDCINCTEHVCVKGDTQKTARVKQCLKDAEEQLERAGKAEQDGYAGVDRWLEHHRMTVERLRGLVAIFDDPNVPKGSIIQLSNNNEFSPIGIAVDDRCEVGDAEAKILNRIRALGENKKMPATTVAALPEGGL